MVGWWMLARWMGVIQAQIFVFMGVLGYETNAAM